MKKGICYIVGAGEDCGIDFIPTTDDFVIAADAGLCYLEQAGMKADLVIGDFDTLNAVPQHPNVISLSIEKDDTDMLAAIREGINVGYSNFYLYCGTGGRIDHTLANLQILSFLSENGKQGFLIDNDNIITAITNQKITFDSIQSGYVSIFAYSPKAKGICLQGLKYELDKAVLTSTLLGLAMNLSEKKAAYPLTTVHCLLFFREKKRRNIDYEKSIIYRWV